MNVRTFAFACVFAAVAAVAPAKADVIALWNFNDAGVSGTNSPANTTALFAVDRTAPGTLASMSSTFAAANIVNFGGTTVGAVGGDVAGQALALQGGDGNANNGQSLSFFSSTVGFSAISVAFATQATATGFNSNIFQYTTNGGASYTTFASYVPATSFAPVTFDLTGIAALANNAAAGFRIIFNGATSASGNNRIDNLSINGTPRPVVPEPSSLALAGVGLASVALAARRRRSAKS